MKKTRFTHGATVAAMLVLASLSIGSMTACTSSRTSSSAGEYVDDAVISNKVRGAMIADKNLSFLKIGVETYKGVVQLSGFVDSVGSRQHAGAVAAGVDGVKHVRNDLVVK